MSETKKEKEPILNVYQRFHVFMREVGYVQKEEKTVNNQYRFVSHDGVVAAIRPALLKNGLIITSKIKEKTLQLQELTETVMVYDKGKGAKVPNLDKDGKPQVKTTMGYVCTMLMGFEFINIDKPEERISAEGYGMGIDSQDKAAGKASSYAKKYALLNALLLETGDDPEKDVDYTIGQKFDTGHQRKSIGDEIMNQLNACANLADLKTVKEDYKQDINRFRLSNNAEDKQFYEQIVARGAELASMLSAVEGDSYGV